MRLRFITESPILLLCERGLYKRPYSRLSGTRCKDFSQVFLLVWGLKRTGGCSTSSTWCLYRPIGHNLYLSSGFGCSVSGINDHIPCSPERDPTKYKNPSELLKGCCYLKKGYTGPCFFRDFPSK